MARQLVDKYEDGSVPGNDTEIWEAPDIPNGQTVHLTTFGAAAAKSAVVALQKRIALPNSWKTIRAIIGPGQDSFKIDRDLVGDGTLKLRVVRQNKDAAAQSIVFWLEGYRVT